MRGTRFVVLAAAAAVAATPGSAAAHSQPTVSSVARHLERADDALDHVASLMASGYQRTATRYFDANRRETLAATREARRMARSAKRAASALRAARALKRVGHQRTENERTLMFIVPTATGDLQLRMARAVRSDVRGRHQAGTRILALAPRLSGAARINVTRSVEELYAAAGYDVTGLALVLGANKLPTPVAGVLADAGRLAAQSYALAQASRY
jgi:hypothetical protein